MHKVKALLIGGVATAWLIAAAPVPATAADTKGTLAIVNGIPATFLLAEGFTLEDVKNLLGRSSIVLTSNTYGHVLEQRQRQVALGMDAGRGGA